MFLPTTITLKLGDSGDFVAELQRRLCAAHCFNEAAINGFFDGNTAQGVSQFQSMSGLRVDGIAGPETLRRLNGVISGDNSSTEDHKSAEEAAAREQLRLNLLREQELFAEQQRLERQKFEQQQYEQQQRLAEQAQYTQPHTQPPYAPATSVAPQPLAATYTTPELLAQPQPAAPTPHSPTDILHMATQAAMLAAVQATGQQPAMQPTTAPQPLREAATPTQQMPVSVQEPSATAVDLPARGMVGRAVQYASDMLQKLANYFEQKLPRQVIDEVKEIGLTMAKAGVKEAPIPGGPEQQQQRGQELPSRGAQQSQQRT